MHLMDALSCFCLNQGGASSVRAGDSYCMWFSKQKVFPQKSLRVNGPNLKWSTAAPRFSHQRGGCCAKSDKPAAQPRRGASRTVRRMRSAAGKAMAAAAKTRSPAAPTSGTGLAAAAKALGELPPVEASSPAEAFVSSLAFVSCLASGAASFGSAPTEASFALASLASALASAAAFFAAARTLWASSPACFFSPRTARRSPAKCFAASSRTSSSRGSARPSTVPKYLSILSSALSCKSCAWSSMPSPMCSLRSSARS
mmetsp:Transcript_100539/g.288746  ORF Transcript_100539/g.288746 Transcript_100539/m.288746 type:complete len:257 (-) Transcript_100539:344-1114(-)